MIELVEVDVKALSFVLGTIIPVLVALLTKAGAHPGIKAVLNALLAAIAGVVSLAIASNGEIVVSAALSSIATVWFSSVATYYGLLKPTGTAGAVAESTKSFGLGSNGCVPPPTPEESGTR